MANALLDPATPEQLAERGQAIETEGKLEDFRRLAQIVERDLAALPGSDDAWRRAPVAIRLGFGWADARRRVPALQGHAAADLTTICQRCLEPFRLHVETDLNLLLMRSGGTSDGHEEYEVWEHDEETLRPVDIVEEALIMALPLAAMHASPDDCGVLVRASADNDVDVARPFAGLRSLLENSD